VAIKAAHSSAVNVDSFAVLLNVTVLPVTVGDNALTTLVILALLNGDHWKLKPLHAITLSSVNVKSVKNV
jgi:hypothetical protein